eukprot:TRINITY_DN684_c0_g1_i3.p1 TRINITY_DN684_c0_g1~~TRINITY_DN684_c0_g1_i3.p1  ORF type:complete len:630 (-),score=197.02 TRINITY_DN684_c0_g1_i3:743-2632(-)
MSLHMHSHEDDSNGHKQPPSDFSDFSICPTPTTSNIFSSITYSPSVPPSVPPSVLPSVSPPLTHFTLPVSTVEESPVVLVAAKRARNLNKRLDKINKLIAQRDSGEIVLNNDQEEAVAKLDLVEALLKQVVEIRDQLQAIADKQSDSEASQQKEQEKAERAMRREIRAELEQEFKQQTQAAANQASSNAGVSSDALAAAQQMAETNQQQRIAAEEKVKELEQAMQVQAKKMEEMEAVLSREQTKVDMTLSTLQALMTDIEAVDSYASSTNSPATNVADSPVVTIEDDEVDDAQESVSSSEAQSVDNADNNSNSDAGASETGETGDKANNDAKDGEGKGKGKRKRRRKRGGKGNSENGGEGNQRNDNNNSNNNNKNQLLMNNGGVYPYYHLPAPYFTLPGTSTPLLAQYGMMSTPPMSGGSKTFSQTQSLGKQTDNTISPDMILCAQQLRELYEWGTRKTPAGKTKSGYYMDMEMEMEEDEHESVENTNSASRTFSHGENKVGKKNLKSKRRLYRGLSQDTVGTEGTLYDDGDYEEEEDEEGEDDHDDDDTDRESLNGSSGSVASTSNSVSSKIVDPALASSLLNKKKKTRASKESTAVLNEVTHLLHHKSHHPIIPCDRNGFFSFFDFF